MKKRESESKHGFFRYDGGFYTLTGKIFDLCAICVYWLIGCLPLITVGASFCAMYATVVKAVRKDQSNVTSEFWKVYLRDMKASIPIWLLYAAALFVVLLNFGIIRDNTTGLVGLFFVVLYAFCGVFLLTAACYVFPLLSRFEMPFGWHIKLSLYMTVRYLPKSLLFLLLFLVCYLIVLWQPFFVLLIPALGALASSFFMEPLLERHMPQEAAAKETADEEEAP